MIEIIGGMVELTPGCIERAFVGREHGSRYRVELFGGIALQLAKSRDLLLLIEKAFSALIRCAQHTKPDSTEGDEHDHDAEKSDQ